MSIRTSPKESNNNLEYQKMFVSSRLAGLARSHKIIRTEKGIEVQFIKLCSQIKLDDSKRIRSERQREERRLKRLSKYNTTTTE
jgi:hypothetical protein